MMLQQIKIVLVILSTVVSDEDPTVTTLIEKKK